MRININGREIELDDTKVNVLKELGLLTDDDNTDNNTDDNKDLTKQNQSANIDISKLKEELAKEIEYKIRMKEEIKELEQSEKLKSDVINNEILPYAVEKGLSLREAYILKKAQWKEDEMKDKFAITESEGDDKSGNIDGYSDDVKLNSKLFFEKIKKLNSGGK